MSVYQDAHLDKPGTAPIVSVVMVKLGMALAEIAQLEHSPTLSAQDASAQILTVFSSTISLPVHHVDLTQNPKMTSAPVSVTQATLSPANPVS